MKFFAFALFALLAPNTISAKSDDVEGEISIEIDSKCDLHCEWTAKDRRRLRGDVTAIEFIHNGRRKLVDLKDVVCTLTYKDKDDHEIEIEEHVDFPDHWTLVTKEADDAADYFGFLSPLIEFKKDDVVVGSGTVELELLKVDIFGTSKSSDDVLVYDDSGISVTCPVFD
mmetsp:Transcript_15091/g.24418  ORF Transcript_15091/g.24418 Transcript_15091/m.24418 type:complete len:170 (+) Transcript_15091:352-861(+)